MRKIIPKKHSDMICSPSRKMEEKVFYPHFRMELAHLPEAKKWDIGKEYTITLKLKMTGISISRYQNDAEFEIHELGIDGEKEEKK